MDKQLAELLVYLNAMWRRRWIALLVAAATCLAGWISVAAIPDTYKASARVYIDTATVLRPLLSGLAVDEDVDNEVRVMQMTLLSRPNLAQVARATDLDLTVNGPSEMELLLEKLRSKTQVYTSGQNLFSISFEDTQPRRAKSAVQAFLNIFMENQLGESRTEMDSARRFIDEQIKDYESQLDQAEQRLADFKQQNMLMLPQSNTYEGRLEELKAQQAAIEAALQDAITERDVLAEQLESIPALIPTASGLAGGSGPPWDYTLRIMQLETELDTLLTRYTDKHPDVIALRRRIQSLRQEERRETEAMIAALGQGSSDDGSAGPEYGVPNPAHAELRLILAEKEALVARLQEQAARSLEKMNELQSMALEVPVVEAEHKRLLRDYGVIKAQYDALLSRRESAKISREREASGEKVQFRVVDPPEAPSRPSGPNRPLLLSAVLPLGFGAGAACAFVLAMLSHTFADPRRLGEELGLPVLGSVSILARPGDRRLQWVDTILFVAAFAAMFAVYGFLMLVESKIGLGKIVEPITNATSIRELVTIFNNVLDNLSGSLGR